MNAQYDPVEPVTETQVVVIGIPWDENSSYQRGAAAAPDRIREILRAGATNWCTESGHDLGMESGLQVRGDLELGSGTTALTQIEQGVADLLADNYRIISLGGDHAITYPILKAFARKYHDLNVLHIDAHPDLYDEFEGNRLSHACTFARIMEENLVSRLVQIGIRAATPHQLEQARRFDVETLPLESRGAGSLPAFTGPLYLSLDLDGLDPAHAPGVSHPEAGGLTSREVLAIIQHLGTQLVGADIVELIPQRDHSDITAVAAAKFIKEIADRMISST